MPVNLENSVVATGLEKVSFHSNPKECSNYCTALISHTSKVSSKFSKPGFNSTWTMNFQMFKMGLEKAENHRSNCQHPLDHWKRKRIPEKHLLLLQCLHKSLWLCVSQQTGKFFKRWEYQIILPVSWETCIQVKKQQLEPYMEQLTSSKFPKEYNKAVYCHPADLTYMQSIYHTKCQAG